MTMLTMTMKMTIPLLMLLNPPQCCRAVQIEREASTLNPSTFTFENSQTFRCPTTLNLQHWNLSKNTEAQKTKLSSVKTIKAPDRWQKKLNFQFLRALNHAKNVTVCRKNFFLTKIKATSFSFLGPWLFEWAPFLFLNLKSCDKNPRTPLFGCQKCFSSHKLWSNQTDNKD